MPADLHSPEPSPADPTAPVPPADASVAGPESATGAEGGDDLPPVEPPSARFIAQLFLIPALIVGGLVVGGFVLSAWFGTDTHDWQTLVTNLGRDNPHRRGRAAHDLAQLLNANRQTPDGRPLREHPPLSAALADLTRSRLESAPESDDRDHLQEVVLLLGLLGLLDDAGTTMPVLADAIAGEHDTAIRLAGLTSIAGTGKRAIDLGRPLAHPQLVEQLTVLTADSDTSLKRDATVALGTFDSQPARVQLESLLADPDEITRYNAAASLLRQGSSAGLIVLREILERVSNDSDSLSLTTSRTDEEARRFEQQWLLVQLSLKAIGKVAHTLTAEQRSSLARAITPLADNNRPSRIRIDAKRVLQRLR